MLPTGTITFLFSDIVGSSRLWEDHSQAMRIAIARHDLIMRTSINEHNGQVVKQRGDGFHAVFASAYDAVDAAIAAQRNLQAENWDHMINAIRVRMSLHTSTAQLRDGDYYGPQLNRAARLESIAHGGQILISSATRELIRDELPNDVALLDLGMHRLKDLARPERVYQLVATGLPTEFPPLHSLDTKLNNLPIVHTSFIGRENELDEIRRLLADPDILLLTLVGPGGIGKTRLVLMASAECIDEFSDGVWLVELASITEAELLPDQVASVFGVTAQEARAGRGVTEVLMDYLRDKSLLLVLDNCEHLIGPCADFAGLILQRCPNVKLLATSREEFAIPGENTYQVSPLPLAQGETAFSDLDIVPSIQLFLERARVVRPEFGLTEDNGFVLADICRQLDGIPLAIELAAARVRVLSLEQISERLQDRFRLLTGGPRTVLPRHQTLLATMDWSYNLLSEPERALMRRLSVFSGGWALEAAEEVASYGGISRDQVLDLLTQLVDKSLVGASELGNTMRYTMLETVRQYGDNKLSSHSETEEIYRSHAFYFARLAEHSDVGLRDARQLESLDILDAEHDNIRSALGWSIENGQIDLAFRLIAAMGWFWFMRGHWVESWRWLTKSLEIDADAAPSLRARAICRTGGFQLIRGNLIGTVVDLVEVALDIFRDENDQEGVAWCLNLLGQAGTFNPEQSEKAASYLSKSVEVFQSIGDDWGESWSTRYLGQIADIQGDYQRAYNLQKQALDGFDRIGDIWNVSHSYYLLGWSAYRYNDFQVAEWAYENSLQKCGIVADKVMEAHVLKGVAQLALQKKDIYYAEELFLEAIEACQKIGDETCYASAMKDLAEIKQRQGDNLKARELLGKSLRGYEQLGNEENMIWVIERFASLAYSSGDNGKAARLLGFCDTYYETGKLPLPKIFNDQHYQLVSSMKNLLGKDLYQQFAVQGAAMSLDEAVAYGLEYSPEN